MALLNQIHLVRLSKDTGWQNEQKRGKRLKLGKGVERWENAQDTCVLQVQKTWRKRRLPSPIGALLLAKARPWLIRVFGVRDLRGSWALALLTGPYILLT